MPKSESSYSIAEVAYELLLEELGELPYGYRVQKSAWHNAWYAQIIRGTRLLGAVVFQDIAIVYDYSCHDKMIYEYADPCFISDIAHQIRKIISSKNFGKSHCYIDVCIENA